MRNCPFCGKKKIAAFNSMGPKWPDDTAKCKVCGAETPILMWDERAYDSLIEAAKKLVHLHLCEQEAIDMPTAEQWEGAVDALAEEIKKCGN